MSVAVDIVVSVVAKILEYVVRPIARPFGYIINHNSNINGLRSEIQNLENTRFGVQQRVDVADRNGEVILPNVQDWLTRAIGIATESENFLNNEVNGNQKSCISGSCPNLKFCYEVSRKAKKKTMVVDELLHDGKFDHISYPPPRPPLWPTTTSTGDLDNFESRKPNFTAIMEALEDDFVSIIGVYGMGGIGKTTFVQEVAQQAEAYRLFDEIVMVVISHAPNLRKIQVDLAEMLGLNLKEESELLRTARLRQRLSQVKRILVILDDMWAPLDLQAIGISHSNVHKGCKVILTSRSLDVCNAMNTQRNFYLNVLSEAESWNLFRQMADNMVDSSDLYPIATKVAKRCSGLPLAIVTVARALRHRSKHAWRDALRQLRNSTPKDIKGMYASVFLSLELSYNFLESEEVKSCFLLCSLFKEDLDIPIEYLVRYGMGLRLFQDVHTTEEARDRAHTLVENLKACCLLLDGDGEECFRMHDVTRDFLISVASRGRYVFSEIMMPGYLESPNSNKLNNCYAMSVEWNDLEEFPIGLDCPKLQLWRSEHHSGLRELPGNFFQGMKELKVVDIHHVCIPSMPPSFLALRKLLTLCLEYCKLGDLSQIGELKYLEILSFIHSDIEKLPSKIGELAHLKLLDLTDCRNLTVIPFGVFSRLSHLECLYMMNSFIDWGFEGQNIGEGNATLAELKHLSHLSTLEMHIPDAELFPRDLLLRNLARFKIFVGMDLSKVISYSYPKTLRLGLHQGLTLHGGIYTLLKGAQHLVLDYPIVNYPEDLQNVVYDLKKGLGHLRCLEVYGYSGIESLIDTNIFPVLEKLKVVSAANLKMICHDNLPPKSFCELRELMLSILPELTNLWKDPNGNICLGNLRTVYVSDCHELEDLFSQSTARDFLLLQNLHVSLCENLKVILSRDGRVAARIDEIVLPRIKSLKLEFLPSLQSFCPETNSSLASDGNLEAMAQEPLFNAKVVFPALEELSLRELDFVKEIWQQQLPAKNFCSLRILTVFRCDNIVIVFPSYLQRRLHNLEILSVEWCDSVEEVCELEGIAIDNENDATSPTLSCIKDLQLGKLPQLKHLWWNMNTQGYISLQNLISLHIYECDGLRYLFSLSAMKGLIQLQQLEIRSCKMMKGVFANEGEEDEEVIVNIAFHELCSLQLEELPELSSFCQRNHRLEFPSLETMEIKGCPKMTAFSDFEVHQEGNIGNILPPFFNEKVSLPELQKLCLTSMNSLVAIWQSQLPENSFCKLQVLEVTNCDQLLDVGPYIMLPRLQMLEVLHITGCGSLKEVFVPKGPEIQQDVESVSLTSLIELRLDGLPTLRNIWWDMHSHGFYRFQSLCSLEVANCDRLNYIFSPSVARGLVQLQKLKVDSCQMLKEIVGKHSGEIESEDVVVLPQISNIELYNLPNVVSFCTKTSALKWLFLKELRIVNCFKMRSFISIPRMNDDVSGGTLEESPLNSSQPFFSGKVVFPCLEKLRIDNLQSLKDLWHKDTVAVSFCQLRVLEVRNCNNLLNLVPFSLLSRLQNLEELFVNQCDSLEEILEQGEGSGDKVVLPLFHTLRLINLPKLGSFYWGNCSLEFPNLEKVALEDCPSMCTFSSGLLITPKLNAIGVWEGDLNSTIQHRFKVKENLGG